MLGFFCAPLAIGLATESSCSSMYTHIQWLCIIIDFV
jgi:hypothetical protein